MLCRLSYVGETSTDSIGYKSATLAPKGCIKRSRRDFWRHVGGLRADALGTYRPEATFPTSVMISALPRILIAAVSSVNCATSTSPASSRSE